MRTVAPIPPSTGSTHPMLADNRVLANPGAALKLIEVEAVAVLNR